MVSWRIGINCIFKTRNAVVWAPDQRRMNRNDFDAAVWSYDQRYIQSKFIIGRP